MNPRAFLYRGDGALRAPWRLLAFAAIALVVMFALQFLDTALRPLSDIPPGDPLVLVASFSILAISLLAAHAVMLKLVDRKPWAWVGLGGEHAEPKPLLAQSVLGVAAIGVPAMLLLAIGWLRFELGPGGTAEWVVFAISMLALLAPSALFEELLFRGYPFAVLREAVGWKGTVLVTSVLFSLVHFENPGAGPLPLLVVFLAGVWLAAVLLATGSLFAAWLAHLAWNWTLVGLLHAPVSGFHVPPPAYQTVNAGPVWATGGVWGPEGGVFAALGLIAVTWYLLTLWRRRRVIVE